MALTEAESVIFMCLIIEAEVLGFINYPEILEVGMKHPEGLFSLEDGGYCKGPVGQRVYVDSLRRPEDINNYFETMLDLKEQKKLDAAKKRDAKDVSEILGKWMHV